MAQFVVANEGYLMLSSANLPLTHHWVVQSISFSSSWRYVRCRLRFSTKNQSNLPIHAILRQNRCWMILQRKAMSDLYAWSGYILLLSWVVLSWFVELLFQLITWQYGAEGMCTANAPLPYIGSIMNLPVVILYIAMRQVSMVFTLSTIEALGVMIWCC